MELTKFSERNLNVILNFLLHAGLEDEYTQAAHDYIAEDHANGEDSEEAHLERAQNGELIIDEAYLDEEDNDEEFPYCVKYDKETELIYAIRLHDGKLRMYRLTKPQEEIEVEHRDEILRYCLSKFTKDDEVSLRDIFSHRKYIEAIIQN